MTLQWLKTTLQQRMAWALTVLYVIFTLLQVVGVGAVENTAMADKVFGLDPFRLYFLYAPIVFIIAYGFLPGAGYRTHTLLSLTHVLLFALQLLLMLFFFDGESMLATPFEVGKYSGIVFLVNMTCALFRGNNRG